MLPMNYRKFVMGNRKSSLQLVSLSAALRKLGQVSTANIVLDEDGKIRRALLAITFKNGETKQSLAGMLALMYLNAEGITLRQIEPNNKNGLGKAVLARMKPNDGGYVRADTNGYQTLLKFRNHACRGKLQACHVYRTVSISY